MANLIFGKMPYFDHTQKDWAVFQNQLEQFLIANEIKDAAKKKAILLTSVCETSYMLLQNLVSPAKVEDVGTTYETCLLAMNKHFKVATSGFAERYKFYNATKLASETINEWAVRVRALAVHCEFGANLDTAIRDKFVMGLEKGPARDKIFLESVDSSFEKVLEIANNVEYTKHQYNLVQEVKEENLNFIKRNKGGQQKKQQHQQQRKTSTEQCKVCGYNNHRSENCKFKNYKCNNCKQKGHLKKMCSVKSINFIDNSDVSLYSICSNNDGPIKIKVFVKEKLFEMELDTGSENNAVSVNFYKTYFKNYKLRKVDVLLRSYNGANITTVGSCDVEVRYGNKIKVIPFVVIENGGPPLLGRNFLKVFEIEMCKLNYCASRPIAQQISGKFKELFDGSLGVFKGGEAVLNVKEGTVPKFFRPRPLPVAIKSRVEKEIDNLVKIGVLQPVKYCEWGTPIVPIVKKNGSIRICGDFKVTLNPNLNVEKYPLPRIEDIFSKLHGGEEFTKLDLSMAYQQVKLSKESRKYTTISTSKGLFQYTRLIYGLASAPAIFQRIMDTLLAGLNGVVVFLDDILISAPNRKLHVQRLEKVLNILNDAGFKLSAEKCEFFSKKIQYLGHVIDKSGLHINPEKINEIANIPYPTSVKQLQAFLGVVNFYRRFLPDVSTLLHPLHKLLRADTKFVWNDNCSSAVDRLKSLLLADNCLAHFNEKFRTRLTVDASPVGVGAVLSQIDDQGVERPIEFASKSLTDTEKRYSQLDREAVAILFGVRKFHHYLYGRHFTLVTDNKPLHYIFNPKKGIPLMASSRLQRIALALSGYQFDISHIKSKGNIADYFSRYPKESNIKVENFPDNVYINYLQSRPENNNFLDFKRIVKETEKDLLLQKVRKMIRSGWPERCPDPKLLPYFLRRNELGEEENCIFWGYRVIIPTQLTNDIVQFLHASHMGVIKMKAMARECCWWPGQSKDLEDVTRSCKACLMTRPSPPKQELIPWPRPDEIWSRLHIDFFGPFLKRWCLVIVDSSSKWVECIDMGTNTTSDAVIAVLRELFARFGLPKCIVSDNGTSFVSSKFKKFLEINGIEQITTPVGHPSTNGQAENGVKLVKNALKRSLSGAPLSEFNNALCRFLFDYRNTIHSSIGVSPASLIFNKRKLRTRLDLINPKRKVENKNIKKVKTFAERKQKDQIRYHKGSKNSKFMLNDSVIVKDYTTPGKVSWTQGTISKVLGKQTYLVNVKYNRKWKRHANQIISCNTSGDSDIPTTVLDPFQKVNLSNVQENLNKSCKINDNENTDKDTEVSVTQNDQSTQFVNKDVNNLVEKSQIVSNNYTGNKYNLRQRKIN